MKRVRLAAVGAVVIVLSGCFGAGLTPDADTGADTVDFSQIEVWTLDGKGGNEGHDFLYSLSGGEGLYSEAFDDLWWAELVFPVVNDWSTDSSASYVYTDSAPDLDVAWSEANGVYIWDISHAEGEYSISVSTGDETLAFSVTIDGTETMDGSISVDGLSGSGVLVGESKNYNYSWGSSVSPGYDITLEIEEVIPSAPAASSSPSLVVMAPPSPRLMTIDTVFDTSFGEYSGTDSTGGEYSGDWPMIAD
jgi:hypothetical protein